MAKKVIKFLFISFLSLIICINANAENYSGKKTNKYVPQIAEEPQSRKQEETKQQNKKDQELFLVKSDKLEIKDSPFSNASVIGVLAKGDTVRSVGFTTSTDKFNLITKLIKLKYNDEIGYVDSTFLNKIDPEKKGGIKLDPVSVYAGLIFMSSVILLGLLAQ